MLSREAVFRHFVRKALEFSSPEALKKYLGEHPKADRKKHMVKEPKKIEPSEKPSKKPKAGLFESHELKDLAELVAQPTQDPDKLFKDAKKAHNHQLKWLNQGKGLDKEIGASVVRGDKGEKANLSKPGPVILIGPMKQQERSEQKVQSDFGGDWSKLGDIVRASVALDSWEQLEGTLAKLKKSGLKLASKPSNRFAKPTEAGYRDLKMNVIYPNGHVGELQMHLKSVLDAKNKGHKFYEKVRSIEADAKKEGRKTLTNKEQTEIEGANRQMRDLYDKAWSRAMGKTAANPRIVVNKKYYALEGLPAFWEHRKFPVKVTSKGEVVVYELQEFFGKAQSISESEFDALVKSISGKKS